MTSRVMLVAFASLVGLLGGVAGGRLAEKSPDRRQLPVQGRPSEDCGALKFNPDGTFSPLTCPDGRPNVRAIDEFRHDDGITIDLGPNALPGQINRAVCADVNGMTDANDIIVQQEYQLAAVRFGWKLNYDPTTPVDLSSCRLVGQ